MCNVDLVSIIVSFEQISQIVNPIVDFERVNASWYGHCLYISEIIIRDALRDSVRFVLFEKREKHPWRSVTFSKVTKSDTPP